MSSLWKDKRKKLTTNYEKPSPKYDDHIQSLAQDLLSPQDRKIPLYFFISNSIKRISLFTSRFGMVNASMTVEAAIVLPLFLFFFLNLSCAIEMVRLHCNMELALWEAGNAMSVYGYAVTEENEGQAYEQAIGSDNLLEDSIRNNVNTSEDTWWNELAGVVLSYTYVKNEIVDYLGRAYLESSPLTYGVDGLQFIESNIYESDDKFEVIVTYEVSSLIDMVGFHPFRMANRYYGHIWNGYEIPTIADSTQEQMVYITEYGQVYHQNRNCTHLQLSVRLVAMQEVIRLRNENGQKYTACEKCCDNEMKESVYITDAGRCYHYRRDCSGLKRRIVCVEASKVNGYKVCSRCG